MIMSAACFVTSVPVIHGDADVGALDRGASFTPSPVIATPASAALKGRMMRS
jgi:hypothetical protein